MQLNYVGRLMLIGTVVPIGTVYINYSMANADSMTND